MLFVSGLIEKTYLYGPTGAGALDVLIIRLIMFAAMTTLMLLVN